MAATLTNMSTMARVAPVKATAAKANAKAVFAPVRTGLVSGLKIASGKSVAAQAKVQATRRVTTKATISAAAMTKEELMTKIKPGVVTGDDLMTLLAFARDNEFAIPAVNVTSSSLICSCLEAAAKAKSPMIIQFSNGGGLFMAGKSVKDTEAASIAGTVAGAKMVHEIAALYGVPVILHTDHCAKKLLPWFDGLIEANETHFKETGAPLFSSHMLDLSEEPLEENLEICQKYLKRMSAINCLLEMELGITGGEEDGVDNTDVAKEDLYSKPEEIHQVYKALQPISPMYTIAAAFGNVHGVYQPGNVQLEPEILGAAQKYIKEKEGLDTDKPVFFVFHGGSGSSAEDIRKAISYGVIKMNIDTDTQWSYWEGVKEYITKNHDYLQGQIGNPEGADKPNKKYYDPRMWIRNGETATVDRLMKAYDDLQAINVL